MAVSEESIIHFPSDVIEASAGLSFDIGATLAKCVYRSKKDYEAGKPTFKQENQAEGRLHSILFLRTNISSLMEYVKDNCDITPLDGSSRPIFATGCGSSQFKGELEEGLGIRITIISEWDAFIPAFKYFLNEMPPESVLFEPNEQGLADADLLTKSVREAFESTAKYTNVRIPTLDTEVGEDVPQVTSSPDVAVESESAASGKKSVDALRKPVMLIVAGSSVNWLQVGQSKSVDILDMDSKCGSTFVGLGCLLLRENKSFAELIDLASKGDQKLVNMCGKDFRPEIDHHDMYSQNNDDMIICRFGRAITAPAESFLPEDMLAGVLAMICQDLIAVAFHQAELKGLTDIYLVGNFVNNEHVRRVMTCEFAARRTMLELFRGKQPIEFHFMRHGGFLGALGCLLGTKV